MAKPGPAAPAALLDVDGTLVDSNGAHARAFVDAFSELGMQVPVERVRRLIGKGGDKLIPEISGKDDAKWIEEVAKRKKEAFYARHFDTIRPFPRVRELLERMKEAGLALVVATSAQEEEMHKLLGIAGVEDLFDESATKDDAKRSKPDPDIIGAALKRAGVDASRAIMLGDTPYDVEAARRAGVETVALESGGWKAAELAGAVAVYADAAALLREFDASPLARLARMARAAA